MDDSTFHYLLYSYNDDPNTSQFEWEEGVRDAVLHYERASTPLFEDDNPWWRSLWLDQHPDYHNGYRVAWDIASGAIGINTDMSDDDEGMVMSSESD